MPARPDRHGGTPFDAWIAAALVLALCIMSGLVGFAIGAGR
ncbi:MAG: hypothetical protein ACOY5R_10715 [Pseudomonadota bacterium]|jgi:hypothetical protein